MDSTPPKMSAQIPASLRLRLAEDGNTIHLSFHAQGVGEYEAVTAFHSPVLDQDASDARWLLEDYPRLQGRSSDPIAARIKQRLHDLAGELREAAFESSDEVRPIREALSDSRLVESLRVQVDEPAAVGWIPWELMLAVGCSDPLSILAASFTRRASSVPGAQLPAASAALRVLLVTCRPSGEEDVPFRSVASRIVQAVAASPHSAIRVDVLRPPTYGALREALDQANASGAPYDGVHFDGHGVYHADLFDPGQKRGYLLFEGADGSGDEVSGSIIGEDLKQAGVRWLLLNACRSVYAEPRVSGSDSPEITQRAFGSLASEVQAAGVAGVLAVGFNLYVVTAARLVADAYAALAAGRDLGEAVAHTRRRLYRADSSLQVGEFDWLVPIAFQDEAIAGQPSHDAIRELDVQVSTVTPVSAGVFDTQALDGPRSDRRPFFGFDDVILRLDRACTAGRPVELVGLTGSGKSAIAGEFARWWAATSGNAAVVLEFGSFSSCDAFEQELAIQLQAAEAYAPDRECLVVLEEASGVLEADSERWTTEDQSRLQQWVEQRADASAPVILTGRTSCTLESVETLSMKGLDDESRLELATHAGFPPGDARSAPGLLQWSQGVPAVVLQMPRIVEGVDLREAGAVRKQLQRLRSGKTEPPEQGIGLITGTGLEFFNVSQLRRAILPFVLALFQGYVSDHQWSDFCEFVTMKGLKFASETDPLAVLKEELRAAERAGLVCRMKDGYLIHPLAPIAIRDGFAATLQALTGGDPTLISRVMGATWGSYAQSVIEIWDLSTIIPTWDVSRRWQLENLWNALEITILGECEWWDLTLPLLHKLREVLLAKARDPEWQEVLGQVLTRLQESPPNKEDMGPESAEFQIIRLAANEAEREGNQELEKALRELQTQIAYSEDLYLEWGGPDGSEQMDIGCIHRIMALLKQGDIAAREKSQECMTYYNEARRLADESNDMLRIGEVYLAMARGFLNVPALYDPVKYEYYARQAFDTGRYLGPFRADLVARASLSLGNAIVEQQRQLQSPEPGRLAEARQALTLAATADTSGQDTRGSARNGLGNLFVLVNDYPAASEEYLEACKEFEAAGDKRSLLGAQTNASRALAAVGRREDACNLALQALDGLRQEQSLVPQLLPILKAVLTASQPSQDE